MARYLGIDYGEKRIGIAMSDELGIIAKALKFIPQSESAIAEIIALADVNRVSAIVVGVPKNMNGTLGPAAEAAIAFADQLKKAAASDVYLWDERLTTCQANRTLLEANVSRKKRKQAVDSMAAQLLLQNYLDRRNM
ncbi:MAG: Holliday junction resolvase RuvX [Candidatus Auribacterota bacterium]